MKAIKLSEDVVAIGAFKSQAAAWLNHLRDSGHPLVITKNGKPAGVLLSPLEFDRLQDKERFLESVAKGLADAEADRVMDGAEVHRRLSARRKTKKAA
jgi:prevent-host-death family protein